MGSFLVSKYGSTCILHKLTDDLNDLDVPDIRNVLLNFQFFCFCFYFPYFVDLLLMLLSS